MQHVPLISEDRAAPSCACIHWNYHHHQIHEILRHRPQIELKPAESEHTLRNLPWKWQKTFDLSNTLPHLQGNHKAFQSHAVTMFKNSSSSLDTQTIPLKPLPCPARWTLHLAIIFATYAASPRQVHGNGRNPCIEAPFFSAAGNPHLARVCKKPRALNLSNFYVGTWSPNNDFGATLKLKVGARYFPDFCHQRI